MPAAEEQDDHQEAGGDHVRVFADEKEGQLESVVFGVIAADELLLRFGQVERQAIAFGESADHEQQKRQRLEKDVPAQEPGPADQTALRLMPDDALQVQ